MKNKVLSGIMATVLAISLGGITFANVAADDGEAVEMATSASETAGQSFQMDEETVKAFEEKAEQYCAEKKIPGFAVIAADRNGVVYENAFGTRDLATGLPMTVDSVFAQASMTKAIVATAAMQLVEQGKIGLDQDISEILPDKETLLILDGFDDDGVPIMRRAKEKVTLRRLLSNTSGVSHQAWDPVRMQWLKQFGIDDFGYEARRVPLRFEPGEDWAYGLSLDWAAEVIETVSGMTLEEYLQENIFKPLGMASTSYHLKPDMEERMAAMHLIQPDGSLASLTSTDFTVGAYGVMHDYGEGEGHGGLWSSPTDYIKFTQMILNGGTYNDVQILKPETVKMMGENQIGDINMHWGDWSEDMLDIVLWYPGQDLKWGLGFMLNTEETPEGRKPGGMAWWGWFNTFFFIDPESGLTGVLMAQMESYGIKPEVKDVFSDFEKMLHSAD